MTTSAAPALRHIAVVGGSLREWADLGDGRWQQRLQELGKVADHIGASWLTVRPFAAGDDEAVAANHVAEVGGCVVTARAESDGRERRVDAIGALMAAGAPVDEAAIAARVNAPAECDPDLVVVLGEGHTLPTSLVWELAYSELVFIDVDWMDLSPEHITEAIESYTHRHRRFGGID